MQRGEPLPDSNAGEFAPNQHHQEVHQQTEDCLEVPYIALPEEPQDVIGHHHVIRKEQECVDFQISGHGEGDNHDHSHARHIVHIVQIAAAPENDKRGEERVDPDSLRTCQSLAEMQGPAYGDTDNKNRREPGFPSAQDRLYRKRSGQKRKGNNCHHLGGVVEQALFVVIVHQNSLILYSVSSSIICSIISAKTGSNCIPFPFSISPRTTFCGSTSR